MQADKRPLRPTWFLVLKWAPIVGYFVAKYLVFPESMNRTNNTILFAVCILLSLGLDFYGKRAYRAKTEATDGTDQVK